MTNTARFRLPAALAAAGALALAACSGAGRIPGPEAAAPAVLLAAYDLGLAMDLAGSQVPDEVEAFYFFVLDTDASGETGELAQKLVQAADEHDFLGIAGADPEHNRAILLAALSVPRERDLDGLVIIYVGPADQEAELAEYVRAAGAELRFVRYAPAPADTI